MKNKTYIIISSAEAKLDVIKTLVNQDGFFNDRKKTILKVIDSDCISVCYSHDGDILSIEVGSKPTRWNELNFEI